MHTKPPSRDATEYLRKWLKPMRGVSVLQILLNEAGTGPIGQLPLAALLPPPAQLGVNQQPAELSPSLLPGGFFDHETPHQRAFSLCAGWGKLHFPLQVTSHGLVTRRAARVASVFLRFLEIFFCFPPPNVGPSRASHIVITGPPPPSLSLYLSAYLPNSATVPQAHRRPVTT